MNANGSVTSQPTPCGPADGGPHEGHDGQVLVGEIASAG
jgi:hypothetical protein